MIAAELPFHASVAALAEVEANARIRAYFDSLILPNAAVFYSSDQVSGPAKADFGRMLRLKTTDSAVVYRGLLVVVCSIVEYFCKQVIESAVAEKAASAATPSDLSPGLLAANLAHTGRIFYRSTMNT